MQSAQRSLTEQSSHARHLPKSPKIVIWIGEESEDSSLAMDTLERLIESPIHKPFQPRSPEQRVSGNSVAPAAEPSLAQTHAEHLSRSLVLAIALLIHRPWFSRIRVVQDVEIRSPEAAAA